MKRLVLLSLVVLFAMVTYAEDQAVYLKASGRILEVIHNAEMRGADLYCDMTSFGSFNSVASGVGYAPEISLDMANISVVPGFIRIGMTTNLILVTQLPAKYQKLVGDELLEMTPAEKAAVDAIEQAAKPARLKNQENILIDLFRDEGVMTTNEVYVTDAIYEAFWVEVEAQPGASGNTLTTRYTRREQSILRFGGAMDDVHWHP